MHTKEIECNPGTKICVFELTGRVNWLNKKELTDEILKAVELGTKKIIFDVSKVESILPAIMTEIVNLVRHARVKAIFVTDQNNYLELCEEHFSDIPCSHSIIDACAQFSKEENNSPSV